MKHLWNAVIKQSHNYQEYYRSKIETTFYALHKVSGETKEDMICAAVNLVLKRYEEQRAWEAKEHQEELWDTFTIVGAYGPEGEFVLFLKEQPELIEAIQLGLHEQYMFRVRDGDFDYIEENFKAELDAFDRARPDLKEIREALIHSIESEKKKVRDESNKINELKTLKRLLKKYPDINPDSIFSDED